MANTGLARGPALFGTFLETNVRLYSVDGTGRRGVVFLSLDTNRPDVVAAARTVFGLPYRWARMSYQQRAGRHTYTSTLRWPKVTATSSIEVQVGEVLTPGPREHFLTARWGLHVARAGRTWYLPNAHPGLDAANGRTDLLCGRRLVRLRGCRILASVRPITWPSAPGYRPGSVGRCVRRRRGCS